MAAPEPEKPAGRSTLNDAQLRAVTHAGGPLLIVAGPGSGKTRVITQRILWLLRQRGIAPERILALTFTNHACDEMRTRLAQAIGPLSQRLWIHTFHAVSLRILRRHGEKINLPRFFSVADEDEQRYWLQKAAAESSLNQEKYPVRRLLDYISHRKAQMRRVDIADRNDDPALAAAAQRYQAYLRQAGVLDFDDLINQTVVLLQQRPDVRRGYNERLAYLLVDEYQDIDEAQYELLRLLTPRGQQISVVADPNQSIYGWRGANPRLIDRFKKDFHPTTITLAKSYRAPANLLEAAQAFINRGNGYPQELQATHPAGTPIHHYILTDQAQEGHLIGRLIRNLHEQGYAYKDMVILYRTHRLADALQQQLLQQGIPLQRIEPDSFYDRDDVKEIVRYLAMHQAYNEYDFLAALNYPHTLIDEPTALQLERIAREANLTLPQLAAKAELFPQISPLTRYRLREFAAFIADLQRESAGKSLLEQIQRLLQKLGRRRSPWTRAEEALLDGFQATVQFPEAFSCLRQAITRRQTIAIVYPASFDGRAAAFLLATFLQRFWDLRVQTVLANDKTSVANDNCQLWLAAMTTPTQTGAAARLGPCAQKGYRYPLAVCAWKLAGDLLVSFEEQKESAYTFYDLETTGTNVYKDEIVEIAALRAENGTPSAPFFHHFVRPSQHHYIPAAASRVHHIYWPDVADQPTIEKVLPAFLAYSRHSILVGHNIQRFDNRIISRELGRYFNSRLDLPSIDTLPLARRLLPGEHSYNQEQLLRRLGLAQTQSHRADDDVRQVAALFYALLDRNLRQHARRAAPDLLPIVGAALLMADMPIEDENEAILHGAARVWQRTNGRSPNADRFLQTLPETEQWAWLEKLSALAQLSLPSDEATTAWRTLHGAFLSQVTAFVNQNPRAELQDFLDYQALRTSLDEADPDADRVTMMTLHNAKGSEYRVVFITTLEENHLPLWRQRQQEETIEEERRLFYVGMTRARERLYLVSVKDRGDDFIRSPSPFTFQLPPELVKRYAIDQAGHWQQL